MAHDAKLVDIFIGSPSDVRERNFAREYMNEWNEENARRTQIRLQPVMWERQSTADSRARGQELINRKLLDPCDILLALIWARLGTPTSVALSGTIEEVTRFHSTGKRVSLYFCQRQINWDDKEKLDQANAVLDFQREMRDIDFGIIGYYTTKDSLERQLRRLFNEIADEYNGR
ncbi:hypothetical protein [Actinacidiphila acididurans]|uniref:Resolvase/invertase-type recombinase catalytic domain-containing protein n=1 Tax=Actinacidiphila acididurans TaxID=2784346 RepID=A0ABS2TPK5_9ACTN|nr:hypothetical protein [Actinacidiphila acididurans]MBM9505275.1 hypothetical protein [Actinacidiphila acididurans]